MNSFSPLRNGMDGNMKAMYMKYKFWINLLLFILGMFLGNRLANAAPKSCPDTAIINRSDEPWGAIRDIGALEAAKNRCVVHYPKSPCVKRLYKLEPGRYHVICGRAK